MSKKQHTLLLNANLTEVAQTRLKEMFNVVTLGDLEENKEKISALVTIGGVKVDAKLINSLPNLKVISTRGVGYDHIDLKTANARGIVVSNTPGVLTDCVADLAFGSLIAISRQIVQADAFVRCGKWLNEKFIFTTKVTGKKLGIVGFGRIGQAVAKRAAAFDMQIRYFSRSKNDDLSVGYEPSLLNLAKWADYLVLCAPGGKSTENMISKEILESLGKDAFLINIARGSLLDETALIKAIEEEKISGAVLDVFKEEPYVPEELLESNKVILLPHIASRTEETFLAMEELLIQNLESFFNTGSLLTLVKED